MEEHDIGEIMKSWLTINEPNDEGYYVIESNNKIPLSPSEFIMWIMHKPDIHFIFKYLEIYTSQNYVHINLLVGHEDPEIIEITDNDVNIIRKVQNTRFVWRDNYGKQYGGVKDALGNLCDPTLKDLYSSQKNVFSEFDKNKKKLENAFKEIGNLFGISANVTAGKLSKSIPKTIINSGDNYSTTISLTYENLQEEDYTKLLFNRQLKEREIKSFLSSYLDLGIYVINILKVKIKGVTFNFDKRRATMMILFNMELIHHSDYYDTIGAYKISWENICLKGRFSKSGLQKLANSLNIDEYNDENLCEQIGDRIQQLQFSDFTK